MAYTYPDIPANSPENTDAVPARTYDRWLITNLACRIQYVEDPENPGEIKLQGSYLTEGRKYQQGTDVVNPTGDKTVYREIDIVQLLERSSVFADAYDDFVTISALLLEQVDAQDDVVNATEDEFEAALIRLRRVYWQLGDLDAATAVTVCIINYPEEWSQMECLIFLGLAAQPPEPPEPPVEVTDEDGRVRMVQPEPKVLEPTEDILTQAQAQVNALGG